ncbi:1509_t:CDS:2 [Funneliformis caledonium]|uniref:alpha-galactosidase n=1 Tax=Funneliformis caledonium TaxID=1117310 RepID=A0A9N8W8Y1_9GLOM|nr:1509_t:CDS:2 [Funneliformis caledonium]
MGLNNGADRTPPMGWNSWNKFHCNIDEKLIKVTADALIKHGLGYLTCAKRPGSLGYEDKDAMTFASWEIDYLKYNNCNNDGTPEQQRYQRYPVFIVGEALRIYGGIRWRTTDIQPRWGSILNILRQQESTRYADPGGWNDPDMLQVDNAHLLRKTPPVETLKIVKNTEIIAINQYLLGKSVNIVQRTSSWDIWAGELSDGHVARELFLHFLFKVISFINNLLCYSYRVPKHGITVLKITGGTKMLESDFLVPYGDGGNDLFDEYYNNAFYRNY